MAYENEATRDRLIVDHVPDVIWLATWERVSAAKTDRPPFSIHFTYFTPSVRRFGYEPEEALQLTLDQLLTPESARRAWGALADSVARGVFHPGANFQETLELDALRKDGTVFRCEVSPAILADEAGRPIGSLGVARDITPRKLVEEALLEEQRLLRQMLDLQERERQLVAYEIHDGLVQQMTAALMHLEAAESAAAKDLARMHREAGVAGGLLREAIGEARRLISGLRPPILDEHGIAAAIEYLANEARRVGLVVAVDCHLTARRLAPQVENTLFRIVQEGLNNVVRHSRAAECSVTLSQAERTVRLTIRDNGVGFVLEQVPDHRFGLRGIRERARLLGGAARIITSPQAGVRIEVELPLIYAEGGGA